LIACVVVTLVLATVAWTAWARGLRPGLAAANPTATAGGATGPGQAAALAALHDLATENPGVDFGVAVVDHRSGRTYQYRAQDRFYTASIVKVEILSELLVQLRQEGRQLSAEQQELATAMIEHSDNDAATSLWSTIGRDHGLAAADAMFRLTNTVPSAESWGSTTTTAGDQVAMLDAIADPAGPLGADNQAVLRLMAGVADDQTWGVSAAAHSGETVELKNGWVSRHSDGGAWTINSIGRITGPNTDLTIAVLSNGHATYRAGVTLVERVATLTRTSIEAA
jgi:beta-lactamase class A